jgi:hypothetical protein
MKGRDMLRCVKPVCVGLLLGLMASVGCVRREIALLTTPPGATVEMDGQLLMTEREVIDREGEVIEIIRPVPRLTPIRLPFSWYGTHKFIVRKEGFARAEQVVHMRPPWYQHFPIDFFSDNVVPWTIKDIRTVSFDLEKEKSIRAASKEEKEALKKKLLGRADEFRKLAREKVKAPIPEPPTEGPPKPEAKPKAKPKTEPKPKSK